MANVVETERTGYDLLSDPMLNKGTAFTESERDAFSLHGLLPPHIFSLEEQVKRRLAAFRDLDNDLERYVFMRDLQDTNETLFYALLTRDLEEMLPIIYTPTVGLGCQRFSHVFRKPRGLFISVPHKDRIKQILSNPAFDRVKVIVLTDGERILGLGDQGAGGMGIPIGKLSLYSACAGIHPSMTLPVMLDVGTDNAELRADPLYIGWRHERLRGKEYDDIVEAFVSAVTERWPHVLLQWEDFAKSNASRLLERYRDRLCTFNDDIQGTAAVATAALLSAMHNTGRKLTEQKVVLLGAGSAGLGISNLLVKAMVDAGISEAKAWQNFYLVDKDGLLVQGLPGLDSSQPFVQKRSAVEGWKLDNPKTISLLDVVRNAAPTTLIGVSGQAGAFSEEVVREMAKHCDHPVIFPLSNPTSRSEATPADVLQWTDTRAIIGTGSPFPPVEINGQKRSVTQTNNSYIFPGMGLGIIATQARRVTDTMFLAAAKALAREASMQKSASAVLPPVTALRNVAFTVAMAVAVQAEKEGLATLSCSEDMEAMIRKYMWTPEYLPYSRISKQKAA